METLRDLEKARKISKDDHKHSSSDVQDITDKHIEDIDKALASKTEEIMQV